MYSAPVASEIVNMNIDIMCQLCHDAMCKKITCKQQQQWVEGTGIAQLTQIPILVNHKSFF